MKLPRSGTAALVTVLALTACGAPGPTSSSTPQSTPPAAPGSVAPSAAAATSTPDGSRPTPAPRTATDDPGAIALEPIVEGLDAPIGFATAPAGWLLVHERGGRVVAVDVERGTQHPVLDIADRVTAGGEQGLLGLALHPGWPDVPRAFVHYSGDGGRTVLAEFAGRVEEGAPVLDATTEQVLLTVEQPFGNHNGGQLAFGPDGHLWMGLGDGGSGGDPLGHGQDPATLLGSILRLDVSAPGAIRIPDDNPFVAGGGAPEVFLFGLRNPWRFSFDPADGRLWIADVGQRAWEEVTRVDPAGDAGANLGWNAMEGVHCFADAECTSDGLLLPLTEYDHDAGCSVTGGAVYRGDALPSLWGWYVFGDYCAGTLFGVRADSEPPAPGTPVEPRILLRTDLAITAFGVDSAGELYLADIASGTVYRIVGG